MCWVLHSTAWTWADCEPPFERAGSLSHNFWCEEALLSLDLLTFTDDAIMVRERGVCVCVCVCVCVLLKFASKETNKIKNIDFLFRHTVANFQFNELQPVQV